MGAVVNLYDRQQRFLGKVLTDEHGQFKLLGLLPALYSVKISVTSFVPATKEILVQPGMRSILNVNLNTLFSTIQFGYPVFESGNIMTDDWKWVLRTAASTFARSCASSIPLHAADSDTDPTRRRLR